MVAINTSQQAERGNNVFLLTTARLLMVLGLAFIARSLYQLSHTPGQDSLQRLCQLPDLPQSRQVEIGYPEMACPRDRWTEPLVRIEGVELEASVIEVPMLGFTSVAGVNGTTLELSVPEPTYNPQYSSSRNLLSPYQQIGHPEASAVASELP